MAKDSKRDVELLRWLAKVPAVVGDAVGRPTEEVERALGVAIEAMELARTCGFCGREVYANLKPMCGDCAGKEDPTTAALRADLAKAKERIAALEVALYDVWGEDPATDPCSVCKSEVGHTPDCIILTLPQVK